VIFAEPGVIVQHNNETGLLPGDRLLEVNGVVVDDKSREEIIDLIKSSGSSVTVKVSNSIIFHCLPYSYSPHERF
jgi:myosin-18